MTTPVDLRYFAGRIEKLSRRLDQVPRMSWATVVTTSPLTIHVDGDPAPLLGEVKNAGPKILLPGTRVQVMRQDLRYTVISASVELPSRGTSAQRVALGLSGAVEDGHRFYDTDEKREYVWRTGEWRRDGFIQQDVTEPIAVAANGRAGLPVTFPEPFTDIPMVTVAQVTPGTNNLIVDKRSVTNSGFVVVVASLANAAYSPTVRWTAAGVG